MKTLLAGLALATFTLPALADVYQVDAGHTSARFSYVHLGLSSPEGRFDKTSGTVTLDLAKKSGAADITIDAGSVSTGVAKLDDHLKSPDFFDTAKYPQITFKSSSFKFEGERLATVVGDLTVHGVTRPVTLQVTAFACKDHPMKKVPACGANVETTIRRSEFGVGNYVPAISDEVSIAISIEALKQ